MTDLQKYIVEGLLKFIIIEKLNKTSKRDNKDLKRYIINEMTFEQALLLNTKYYKTYLLEAQQNGDLPEIAAKKEALLGKDIAQTTRVMEPLLKLGFAIAAGEMAVGMTAQAVGATFGGPVGWVAGILASMGISWGIGLLSKVVQYAILKMLSPCSKSCNQKFSNATDKEAPMQNNMCKINCRIISYKKVIEELKRQYNNCSQTKNPTRCMSGITNQISKYQNSLANEEEKLAEAQDKLVKGRIKTATK